MYRYGLEFADNTSDLDIEFYCLRHDERADHEAGRLSSFAHYQRIVDIIFNNEESIRKHIWSDESIRMSTEFLGDRSDKMFIGVAGNSSCVAGHTVLPDPINGGGKTIQQYCEAGERPWVQTLNGPVLADIPYLKGRAELFEVKLSSGRKFTCTADHRILTPSGWRFLRETNAGDSLVGCAPFPRETNPGTGLLARVRGVLRWFGTAQDLDVQVESITSVGEGEFYDLNVPTEHHYITEGTVHHNSGKSDDLGLFNIIMYLSNPAETLCLLTSTTLEMAKLRVWKAVREYWSQVERYFRSQGLKVPGEAVHSKGRIRGMDLNGDYSDACGLVLVAADKQKGEEATSKVMGAKAPGQGLLILGADELPDLSSNILTVAFTNLVNNPKFWMYGLGNPNLKLDPHGKFCTPREGWDSVSHKPLEWLTERGKCIRFDSESSSRIREEDSWTPEQRNTLKTKYFWQPSREVIEAAARQYGRTSRFFGRMYDAMWTDAKAPNALYSENELMRAFTEREPDWDNPQSLVAISGLDSSFTSGGDLSVSVEALCGKVNGYDHFHVTGTTIYEIDPKLDLAPGHQVVSAWKKHCQELGVRPRAAGFDSSGAGVSFVSIVEMEWSTDTQKINFGASPSGRIHRIDGVTTDEFANRVSELWIQPKEFLRGAVDADGVRHSQITGLTPDIIEELVSRQYAEGWEGAKLKIEAKKKMRARIGRSPDKSDAFVIALEVAILNGWLASAEEKQIIKKVNQRWSQTVKKKKLKLKTRGGMGRAMKF